ncbi:MAG: DUF3883 domain-containing protein, partial [Planctomycetota bacterium]
MERASARRLQPHFIGTFFLAAFRHLGGTIRKREPGRYEIRNVPANIRRRDRLIGTRESVLTKYERITFQKERVSVPGKPTAKFVCPGHPLLDATIDLVLERHRDLLKQGAILVDPQDMGDRIRVLFYLEHSIQDGRLNKDGSRRVISRRIQFVEINQDDEAMDRGYAPYLDYRCLQEGEQELVDSEVDLSWLGQDVEKSAMSYAVQKLVPNHLREIKANKEKQADRTLAAVKARLTKEITYWDHRAQQLEAQEQAGKTPKLNSARARQRAEELANRLQQRQEELAQERRVSAAPPVVVGGALVIPQGLINRVSSDQPKVDQQEAIDRDRVDRLAVDAVMATERRLGRKPMEMPHQNPGYDIESRVPDEPGRLLFIEVKGKVKGRETVAASKTQILTALNKPDDFILAIVEIDGDATAVKYVRQPFGRAPDFGVTSVNYDLGELLGRGDKPA